MKKFKVLFFSEAILDLEEAFDYYQEISPIVAKKFLNATDKAVVDLKKNPFYQVRYNNEFRMKIIKDFPYIIHFIVQSDDYIVQIYGIRNSFINPEKYPKK